MFISLCIYRKALLPLACVYMVCLSHIALAIISNSIWKYFMTWSIAIDLITHLFFLSEVYNILDATESKRDEKNILPAKR